MHLVVHFLWPQLVAQIEADTIRKQPIQLLHPVGLARVDAVYQFHQFGARFGIATVLGMPIFRGKFRQKQDSAGHLPHGEILTPDLPHRASSWRSATRETDPFLFLGACSTATPPISFVINASPPDNSSCRLLLRPAEPPSWPAFSDADRLS